MKTKVKQIIDTTSKNIRNITGPLIYDNRLNTQTKYMKYSFEKLVGYLFESYDEHGNSFYCEDDESCVQFTCLKILYHEYTGGLAYKLASDQAREEHDKTFYKLKIILDLEKRTQSSKSHDLSLHMLRELRLLKNKEKYEKLR